jgi:hypothetical protein
MNHTVERPEALRSHKVLHVVAFRSFWGTKSMPAITIRQTSSIYGVPHQASAPRAERQFFGSMYLVAVIWVIMIHPTACQSINWHFYSRHPLSPTHSPQPGPHSLGPITLIPISVFMPFLSSDDST